MIQPERCTPLNEKRENPRGGYVLYWMQQARRSEDNHALQYAIDEANRLNVPVIVCFGLVDDYPAARLRHYDFMLRGLAETVARLRERNIECLLHHGDMEQGVTRAARNAVLVVTDGGYSRIQRHWRHRIAAALTCRMIQVETDVIVPVALASPKQEYAARTLRPKLQRLLPAFLVPMTAREPKRSSLQADAGLPLFSENIQKLIASLAVDDSIGPVSGFVPGADAALARLDDFVSTRLETYDADRNDPNLKGSSGLSPYLHFGQISPLRVARAAADSGAAGADAFLEELVVRRELAINFVWYNPDYDRFRCLPDWARATLKEHGADPRPVTYTEKQLRTADTDDPYWNAAQKQLTRDGYMHGYMRMYWGKKLIEWTSSPRRAFDLALAFNDAYSLDGRDPNGWAGVAWCFGLHDRPWARRPVFGTVRYMNDRGLRRKFDADAWVRTVIRETG